MKAKANTETQKPAAEVVYAIHGMVEYILAVDFGPYHRDIPFTGGSLSGYGVRPATFSTSDEPLQILIERTEPFKSGRIKRLKTRKNANLS